MLKIGEFSRLSQLTVKALRFYEKEGLLIPAETDNWTGYRYYETSQLLTASKIKAFRQLGLTVDEIYSILQGADVKLILAEKAETLQTEKKSIETRLSVIKHILEDKEMTYQVTEKTIEACIVYSAETVIDSYSDLMSFIPMCGEKCLELNPDIKCIEPHYEFCEYLDGEYRDSDVKVRHSEAVDRFGRESDLIKFREIPETKVLSVMHKGPYERLGEAYAYIAKYAEDNGFTVSGLARECYIDGIWNKDSSEEWLTEIQLPVE